MDNVKQSQKNYNGYYCKSSCVAQKFVQKIAKIFVHIASISHEDQMDLLEVAVVIY
jgi:hypothetical protein